MRYCWLVFCFIVCAYLEPTIPAHAYPAGKTRLSTALEESHVVVVGRIESVGEGVKISRAEVGPGRFANPVQLLLRPCEVRIEAVLKGDGLSRGDLLQFSFLEVDGRAALMVLPIYQPGERWLLYLYRWDDHLEPMNPLGWQDLHIPDGYEVQQDKHPSSLERMETLFADLLKKFPHEKITTEILETIHSGTITIAAPVLITPQDYYTVARPQGAVISDNLVGALLSLAFMSDLDMNVRSQAAAVLCRLNYIEGFQQLVALAETAGHELRGTEAISQIADPRALPILNALLAGRNVSLHRHAAYALRQFADPSSIPAMVQALDSQQEEVRYLAATGLAAVTQDRERYPSTSLFKQKESELIAYWKKWYKERQAKKN